SGLGGILGILMGYGVSAGGSALLVSILEENIKISPSISSTLIAFSISVGIGVLFGYLPARKASRLNPIDALRFE
ncbi:MAG: ABC transporter permease, partial [Bacillota bacterium]|nr:ABC transporter permease [Bacillota bacterium]